MKRLLEFLRLTDSQNNISLSNLLMYVILYKIIKTTALSMQDISIVFIAVSNYNIKKKLIKEQNDTSKK